METNTVILGCNIALAMIAGIAVYAGGGGLSADRPLTHSECTARYPEGVAIESLADRSADGMVAGTNFRGPTQEETVLIRNYNNSFNAAVEFQRSVQRQVYEKLPAAEQRYMQNHWAHEDAQRFAVLGAEPASMPSRHLTLAEKRNLCIGAAAFVERKAYLETMAARLNEPDDWSQ